jgi:hypothetical protein
MARTKISEFSATPASNTDIDSIFIGEGMAPSNVNDAIRELMAQLKDWQSGTSNDPYVVGSSGSLTLNQGTANGVAYLNGSKVVTSGSALTFDGTNLGIGVSTGTAPLDALSNSSAVGLIVRGRTADSIGTVQFRTTDSASLKAELQARTDELRFLSSGNVPQTWYVNGSERMRLDGSGNLGLGVTPSAWGSTKAFDIGTYGALAQLSTVLNLNYNSYFNGTNTIYKNTGVASVYQQSSGGHLWYNAASGTAGNAITFTQAMTLDASGNLALGSTSILGSTNRASFTNATSAKGVLALSNTSSSGYSAVELYDNSGSQQGAIGWGNGSVAVTGAQNATYLYSSGAITFLSGGTSERARIDSDGNLLVGTTSFGSTAIGFGINGTNSSSSKGACISVINSSVNGNTTYEAYSLSASAYRFYVGMAGTVYATSTTITAISDQRLKENIRDLDDGLDVVMALKPRKFDWKEGKGQDIKNARGFIAQEFETVLPDMIETWRDPAPEGEESYKAINANLIPTLVKAIQEQQAIIESLKARLDAANL